MQLKDFKNGLTEAQQEYKRLMLEHGEDLIFLIEYIQEETKERHWNTRDKVERERLFWKVSNMDEIVSEIKNEYLKTKDPVINL